MYYHNLRVKIIKEFKSQAEFCVAIGQAESKISSILNGRRKLSKTEAAVWQKMLDCDGSLLIPVTKTN